MKTKLFITSFTLLIAFACTSDKQKKEDQLPLLKVSENGRYLMDENGNPFFWLGDNGWLLFVKLNREDAEKYLENRKQKGFNIIQVMLLHTVGIINVYGDTALVHANIATPCTTKGNSPEDSIQYDYWDHVDYIIDLAAEKGLYMGLVPVWGGNVKAGFVTYDEAEQYATWLSKRYEDKPNIVWINGGDIKGSDSLRIWNTIGRTLNKLDTNHLITFHPRGRSASSWWFHNEDWLDFNMFQSGHRRYDQDDTEHGYGEDNWRYIKGDYKLKPVKPTLDGEPSYEQIPQGLHDTTQPYWNDNDVRRYAYWSVFAGGCGFTYGHDAVMQFFKETESRGAYGVKHTWQEGMDHPGAGQMIHLKNLMLSYPYFERVPDQSLIAGGQGEKYDYIVATRGKDYACIYTYTGRNFSVNLGKTEGEQVKASWFDPRDGSIKDLASYANTGIAEFDPPGEEAEGNDWVLILKSM